jgi:hypothetical protein
MVVVGMAAQHRGQLVCRGDLGEVGEDRRRRVGVLGHPFLRFHHRDRDRRRDRSIVANQVGAYAEDTAGAGGHPGIKRGSTVLVSSSHTPPMFDCLIISPQL